MVADPLADNNPTLDTLDRWETPSRSAGTCGRSGLGVAEAMDTAQRGMGMDWPTSLELIRRSIDASKDFPARCSARAPAPIIWSPERVSPSKMLIRAYEEQCAAIEKLGGRIVLMASRALVKAARSPDDYALVYGRISPGEGAGDHPLARRDVRSGARRLLGLPRSPRRDGGRALDVVADNAAKVDGVKISLLDKDKEIVMRRRLAQGVRMYTGDDFNYAELIEGDDKGYSDALLGIFDVIAPAAAAALAR